MVDWCGVGDFSFFVVFVWSVMVYFRKDGLFQSRVNFSIYLSVHILYCKKSEQYLLCLGRVFYFSYLSNVKRQQRFS